VPRLALERKGLRINKSEIVYIELYEYDEQVDETNSVTTVDGGGRGAR